MPILALDALQDPARAELMALAAPVAVRPRVEAALLRDTILRLCSGRSLGLQVLAQLLQREPDHLRRRTLAAGPPGAAAGRPVLAAGSAPGLLERGSGSYILRLRASVTERGAPGELIGCALPEGQKKLSYQV